MNEIRKKIIVGLSGGLGNQMFQYAAGRSLSLRSAVDLELDLSWFAGREERAYGLNDFSITGQTLNPLKALPEKIQTLESRISRRWLPSRMGGKIYREKQFHFDEGVHQLKPSAYLEGYWQSEKYFQEHSVQISSDFLPKTKTPDRCLPILNSIQGTQAICLHIRRGDYITNASAAKTHGVCPLSYYQQGVEQLLPGLSSPHCFIFSDDPQWVKENIDLPCAFTVVDVNNGKQANWDLFLMHSCMHFVIANSSLSWWGAWLGAHEEKRVIAPLQWFLTEDKNTKDLLPKNWERI